MTTQLEKYHLVSRAEWGARPPDDPPVYVPWSQRVGVAYHYSQGNRSNGPWDLQNYAMDSLGYGDSHYNFCINASLPLVVPTGIVYEMRGATVKAAHASDHNTAWIGVCVIGQDADVTQADLDALGETHRWLERLGGKTLDFKGHGQLSGASTSCPGQKILNYIAAGGPRIPTTRRAITMFMGHTQNPADPVHISDGVNSRKMIGTDQWNLTCQPLIAAGVPYLSYPNLDALYAGMGPLAKETTAEGLPEQVTVTIPEQSFTVDLS